MEQEKKQRWREKKRIWELTITDGRCWGGGLGVSRGGEHGDDDSHHKDCRGSGDRRHFLPVVLLAGTGAVTPIKTTGSSGCPSLSLWGDQDEERAQRRLAFGSGDAGGRAPEGFIQPYFVVETRRNASMQESTRDGRTASLVPRTLARLDSERFKVRSFFTCVTTDEASPFKCHLYLASSSWHPNSFRRARVTDWAKEQDETPSPCMLRITWWSQSTI